RFEASFEKLNALFAADKTQVRHWMDKAFRRAKAALFEQIGPELLGFFELSVDADRLLNVDRAIRRFRRVVQFTEASVAGTCVVPRVGAFNGSRVHKFNNFKLDGRVEFF